MVAGRQVNAAAAWGGREVSLVCRHGATGEWGGGGGQLRLRGGLPKGRLDGSSGSKRGPAGLRNKARRSRQEVIVGS